MSQRDPLIEDFRKGSIQDVQEKPKASLGIMFFTIFLQSITFTIVLPSLWFYLQAVKKFIKRGEKEKEFFFLSLLLF